MSPLFALSPDAALLLLTLGVALICLELNRPGLILPGAAGLTLVLLAAARIFQQPFRSVAVASCVLGFALLIAAARMRSRIAAGVLATAALSYGFLRPTPASPGAGTHVTAAVPCALFLGIGTSFLTTIAARARQNKGLDLK